MKGLKEPKLPTDKSEKSIASYQKAMEKYKKDLEDGVKKYPFNFLVSHSKEATGFIGNMNVPLQSIPTNKAGGNKAVHWLEDTHQGVINSAKRLPRCTEISKTIPWSFTASIVGKIIKWADEDIGKNSVRPWSVETRKICNDIISL